jgi:hypothetical protein
MVRRYKHLNSEERGVIFAEHRRGASLRAIGSLLGRHGSTISRELRRGRGGDGHYSPEAGRRCHDARRLRSRQPCRLVDGSALHAWVRGKLVHLHWRSEISRPRASRPIGAINVQPIPARLMTTAWLTPFPPRSREISRPRIDAPGSGRAGNSSVLSMAALPMTKACMRGSVRQEERICSRSPIAPPMP